MPGPGSQACPKPEPRRRTKARKDRREAVVAKAVRAKVEARDGYCRLAHVSYSPTARALFGGCAGPSEWAHLEDKRRGRTVNQPPEERHQTAWSAKMCNRHHQHPTAGYDKHAFHIEPMTEHGADGPLRFVTRAGESWEEPSSYFPGASGDDS